MATFAASAAPGVRVQGGRALRLCGPGILGMHLPLLLAPAKPHKTSRTYYAKQLDQSARCKSCAGSSTGHARGRKAQSALTPAGFVAIHLCSCPAVRPHASSRLHDDLRDRLVEPEVSEKTAEHLAHEKAEDEGLLPPAHPWTPVAWQ